MEIAALIFTIIFGIVSISELVLCYLGKQKERKILKTFCVLTLTIVMILLLPNHPFLYCALIFGFLGDLFLIFKKDIFFYLGAFSFFLGHMFYYVEVCYYLIDAHVPYYFYIIFVLSLLLTAALLYKPLMQFTKKPAQLVPGSIYISVLIHAVVLMIVATIYNPTSYMYFAIFGYLSFLASDSLLIYTKFKKTFKFRDVAVMGTYLLAETLICLGFYLTYAL